MKKEKQILKHENDIWLSDPEDHDFPAAVDYLELLFPLEKAKKIAARLKKTKTIQKKAKDIFRASRLPLVSQDNRHVVTNFKKVKAGTKLSPILLVRGTNDLIIADGYHRLCTSYYLTEDLNVPCRLVSLD